LPTETLDDNKKYYVTFTINKAARDDHDNPDEGDDDALPVEIQGRAVSHLPRSRQKQIGYNRA
jgi:hypothetical protein